MLKEFLETIKIFLKGVFMVGSIIILLSDTLKDRGISYLRLIRDILLLPFNYLYDIYRYVRHSSIFFVGGDKLKLKAKLLKAFHAIEKGLSLPAPRPGFGQAVIRNIIKLLEIYVEKYGVDKVAISARNTLISYKNFNDNSGLNFKYLDEYLNFSSDRFSQCDFYEGGVIKISKEDIIKNSSGNFESLAMCRYSIRVFDESLVKIEKIIKAAEIAQKTPSVCNRQTAHIFVFSDSSEKTKILELQNGNRGFGHLASHIVAITSDLKCFEGLGERNQAYVDGGLMAMSFVYALQSLGVGSCFLNWSVRVKTDLKLKKITGIPASHTVITLIAIGNIPAELLVAQSPRVELKSILHIK